jgi:hypothetical protein
MEGDVWVQGNPCEVETSEKKEKKGKEEDVEDRGKRGFGSTKLLRT